MSFFSPTSYFYIFFFSNHMRPIAAKINQPAGDGQGIKRPYEDGPGFGEPDVKKTPAAINDPIGAQLRAMAEQQRSNQATQAAQAAQEAAARLNQQLGVSNPNLQKSSPVTSPGPHSTMEMVSSEYKVPDKLVGLSKHFLKSPPEKCQRDVRCIMLG
ncbi:FUBP [Acanthosepion pharaonis]|uniref:FUBP n=1 Tax=Acanthosepion pharaonis TaxID=158019 RepID=A0A812E3W5_ACAPH|nr:FUBP [Sepia pharaonis]